MTQEISNILGVVDKRRGLTDTGDRGTLGRTIYTANAGGTTTTLVGAASDLSTSANVFRLKDRFKLFSAGGVLKQETVFTVTAGTATGTTLTFTPAALVATVSTDFARKLGAETVSDEAAMDARLIEINAGYFTTVRLAQMTLNDKIFAIRVNDDLAGF